jgi:DNA-binding winged helix-turn-helix (wHTH) protein
LRGLTRTYINRLVRNGYDTPEAIAEVPVGELERILPKRLAQRLHRHCEIRYGPQGLKLKEARPPIEAPLAGEEHPGGEAPLANEAHPDSKADKAGAFAEILANNELLARFRSSLAMTENLSELAINPPTILIDEKQNLFFYAGFRVELAPTTFKLMALLGKWPGKVVSRSEIYERLWPEILLNPDSSSNPYDRQISDHKRKIAVQIKKAIKGKAEIDSDQIKNLIKTRRKVGYMLDLKREEVCMFFS